MTTSTKARHRAQTRAITPLTGAGPAARRSLAVAATSGLALTMIASSASADSDENQALAASAGTLRVGPAAQAGALATTNAAITVGAGSAQAAAVDVVEAASVQVETAEEAAAREAAEIAAAEAAAAEAAAAARAALGQNVTDLAMGFVGSPYVWGAAGPYAFDCSGLVSYVYGQMGVSVPHSSASIRSMSGATVVSASEAQPGDIMWWSGHVAIYAGDGMMISAESESVGVSYMAVRSGAVYLRVSA
ncbi:MULTISPECIES: C40 family peptidase [unclassified Actinomyces]|uniref:C40 family peptidase n=1 Tax=unclassified Actinomyces TaxID=2609248 RepID=UPI002017BF84|nr:MULTISPECIES: C40 family peptidase [unclassified Actinomyces]MCL3778104.1 C40 family peptidase [Actinomyces sp. AC-20-1]MCL3789825.1 C40 family peptidase [Actinomyces sp. 187325]MCL3792431.1 C40 family peptidase [Actinomyces sp. 186855]MCL3794703.1 C40 family peptidase [Actinomyces sp. 217892]